MNFFISAEHKIYFEEYGFHTMNIINCLVTNIFQNIFFYVQQQKEIHTGLEQLEGE